MVMNTGVTIRDLKLRLGSFQLGPVNLELKSKDYFVLMGPSGCGKTSLLKAVAGVYREHEGEIYFGERRIDNLPPQKRIIGYVPQAESLFPHMTVRQNICFGLRYLEISEEEGEARLKKVTSLIGVQGMMDRYPMNLSGGENRRVALARALMIEPKVLLLDEPFSMLDTRSRKELLDILRKIHDEIDAITIHVTHQCEEAWLIKGTCGIMQAGNIVQTGDVKDVYKKPANEFIKEFINVCPFGGKDCEHLK